ncbi:MAG: hypothetical protein ACSLEW_10065 [Nocardioides sp.]
MTGFEMLGSADAQACEGDACLISPDSAADVTEADLDRPDPGPRTGPA